jgi:hypothetical protein
MSAIKRFFDKLLYDQPQQIENKRSLLNRVVRSYNYKVTAEVDTWRRAIETAEYPLRPDRKTLYGLYRQIELDDQVETQMLLARATIRNAPFIVRNRRGTDKTDAAELLDRTWFREFLLAALETEFWGHTLLEFDPGLRDGFEFKAIHQFPREHVRPEYGDVLVNISDSKGIPFRNNDSTSKFLVELGKAFDIGRHKIVALPVIRKKYSDADWSQFSEKYGMPLLSIKTNTRDSKELDSKEAMAKNFGSNGWVILDDQDEIEVHERKNTEGHVVFSSRIDLAHAQIAQTINGQTGTSAEKSFVGSAEVHERVLNELTLDRLQVIQDMINDRLFPVLTSNGYPFAGMKFVFTELEQHRLRGGGADTSGDQKSKPGPAKEPQPTPEPEPQKKKP